MEIKEAILETLVTECPHVDTCKKKCLTEDRLRCYQNTRDALVDIIHPLIEQAKKECIKLATDVFCETCTDQCGEYEDRTGECAELETFKEALMKKYGVE
jgi:hypothetical protein